MKGYIRKIGFFLFKDSPIQRYWHKRKYDEKRTTKRILKNLKESSKIDIYKEPEISVINLNADDYCNSRCVMCNIWTKKKGPEFSPDQLENILKDPLYKNVKHIGVTGGEPTLREDLPLLYEAIFKALPKIESASTITNCINEDEVKQRIDEVIEVCKHYNKPFSMMISLDGIGEVHEKVRRKKGNFASAINVYNYFTTKNIEVATGTTISKINVWDVDDTLTYLIENGMYGRFRIAEFINRLYNEDKTEIIRNFDEDEIYHLILFFYKLIYNFEKNETYQRTYYSIIHMLAGGHRLIGCPYQTQGISLNSRGEVAYCAPKSAIIGDAIKESSYNIYKKNLEEKDRILKNECQNCIHDYHASITYNEKLSELNSKYWKKTISLDNYNKLSDFKDIAPLKKGKLQILITGWYGTETVGDKAILGGIIDELIKQYGDEIHFIISSLYPLITKRTIKELNIQNTEVVAAYSEEFIAYSKGSDISVMGGGPLMDLEELALPLIAFREAKNNDKKTIVYGCGIGPLNGEKYITATKKILDLADVIKLRDQKSIDIAKTWLTTPKALELTGDPAKKYLSKYFNREKPLKEKIILTCYLREWTAEYKEDLSLEDFHELKDELEKGMAEFIKKKALEINADEIFLDHMHNFVIGGDDRDFSRKLIKNHFAEFHIPISYNKKLSTIDSIVGSMLLSTHNICMRFHSVVFADTLQTNFTAIDYTQGGKIYNYLMDNNKIDHIMSLKDIINK